MLSVADYVLEKTIINCNDTVTFVDNSNKWKENIKKLIIILDQKSIILTKM